MIDRRLIALFSVPILIILLFLLTPFITVLVRVIREVPLKELLVSDVISAARISAFTATITTLIVAMLGLPLAYLLAKAEFRGKELLSTLITMPLVVPPLVAGILLLSLYGRQGIIGEAAFLLNLKFSNTILGIILAQTFVSSPYLILAARSAFEQVDPYLEKASLILGKSSWETFFRISLPLSTKGIIAGLIMSWARSVGEFGATVVMAYYPHSLPVKIWADFTGQGLKASLSSVFILISFTVLIIFLTLYTKSTSTISLFLWGSGRQTK